MVWITPAELTNNIPPSCEEISTPPSILNLRCSFGSLARCDVIRSASFLFPSRFLVSSPMFVSCRVLHLLAGPPRRGTALGGGEAVLKRHYPWGK